MRPNLNEQFDSNMLTLFRNDIAQCNIPIVTLIVSYLFDKSYFFVVYQVLVLIDILFKVFRMMSTHCLGIATTPPGFIKKLHNSTLSHTANSTPNSSVVYLKVLKISNYLPTPSIRYLRVGFLRNKRFCFFPDFCTI